MKTKFSFFLILISIFNYAQIIFENGYYIDKNNNKISCQIKNYEWKNNPTEIEIKENDTTRIIKINDINEFEVGDLHYVKKTVKVDKMEDVLDYNINYKSEPDFSTETVMLKVLLEGEANLFSYANGNILKFFYSTKEQPEVKQLIYKVYMVNDINSAKNTEYKKQLNQFLKDTPFEKNVNSVEYNSSSLTKIFKKYNEYKGIKYDDKKVTFSDQFKFTVRAGFYYSSANTNAVFGPTDFNKKMNIPKVGLELEYYLPVNKKSWSFYAGLDYNQYKNSTIDDFTNYNENSKVNFEFSSIEASVGTKYYFYLTNNLKFYVNASYSPEFLLSSKSSVEYSNNTVLNYEDKIKSMHSGFGYGVGLKFKEKYSIDIKKLDRNFKGEKYAISHEFNSIAFNFGYTF